MKITVKQIKLEDRERFEQQVAALESIATYPLGNDSFKINHGSSYFSFFDRMGKLKYYAAFDKDKIVAVACGILRTISKQRTWYLCDLKVHPTYRRNQIPLKMFMKAFLPNYFVCNRGYAISMNNPNQENKLYKLIEKFSILNVSHPTNLELYSFSFTEIENARKIIEGARGIISFLSLSGIKDLELQSTKRNLNILHIQFGPCAEKGIAEPLPDYQHMICMPEGDPLSKNLQKLGFKPTATASIFCHNMKKWDWNFILTSDI